MIALLKNWKIIAIAAAVLAAFVYLEFAKRESYQNGYAKATQEAEQATQKAMDEILDDAEKADFAYTRCVAGGGVWSFTDNKCKSGSAGNVGSGSGWDFFGWGAGSDDSGSTQD